MHFSDGDYSYGLEPTPELYIAHSIEILREIRRVLRKDGVCFWNIGDTYFGSNCGYGDHRGNKSSISIPEIYGSIKKPQAQAGKPKDLCLIPFRVAIAAQEDGWYVRSIIIWSKPNPMPESVKDRPTESHEYILLLTKSSRYFWDMEAVKEEAVYGENLPSFRGGGAYTNNQSFNNSADIHASTAGIERPKTDTRNLRSVWTMNTQPYSGAHFATFPEELAERCIKAGSSEKGCCAKCGKPWERIVDHKNMIIKRSNYQSESGIRIASSGTMVSPAESQTIGWQPSCTCNADVKPCTILDPFMGSGTTLKVAAYLGRNAVGYDISTEYCKLAVERNKQGVLC